MSETFVEEADGLARPSQSRRMAAGQTPIIPVIGEMIKTIPGQYL